MQEENRQGQIHSKGFDMLRGKTLDYSKIKIGTKKIEDPIFNIKRATSTAPHAVFYNKQRIYKALAENDLSFLRQLSNEWGEDEAFSYFEELTDNILQYTSSGSGPVNALVQGEVAIGLGMISQAVEEINQGVDLKILFFDEGAPYSMYGNAIVHNSYERENVKEVFNYLSTELVKQDNKLYFPDQIFKDFVPDKNNYPKNVHYGNMKNDTREEKERLLSKWMFS